MIQISGVYHLGYPVDNLERAEGFYTEVLGFQVEGRIVDQEIPTAPPTRLTRMRQGSTSLVLFQRPRPLDRNTLREDGIAHQAFEVTPEVFDRAMEELKAGGIFDSGPIARPSGRAFYFFDTEGNYLQLHTSR